MHSPTILLTALAGRMGEIMAGLKARLNLTMRRYYRLTQRVPMYVAGIYSEMLCSIVNVFLIQSNIK